jgi:hypothetical protein
MDQVLYMFKSEKSIRHRGLIPLKQLEVHEFVEEEVMRVVPEECKENCFSLKTPWREYVLYTDTTEEKINWLRAIDERLNDVVEEENDT